MEDNRNNQDKLEINVPAELLEGVYSNLAVITHSSAEFILDFIRVMPGTSKAPVKSRVVMAPEHAKRLLYALQNNVQKYEQFFGEIRFPGTPAQMRNHLNREAEGKKQKGGYPKFRIPAFLILCRFGERNITLIVFSTRDIVRPPSSDVVCNSGASTRHNPNRLSVVRNRGGKSCCRPLS